MLPKGVITKEEFFTKLKQVQAECQGRKADRGNVQTARVPPKG